MKLRISSHLTDYTGGKTSFEVAGQTLSEALTDLDRQFPGIRFRFIDEQDRVREHFNVFVNRQVSNNLKQELAPDAEIDVIAALSGG